MSYNKYTNFVRPTLETSYQDVNAKQLSGDEAKKIYLEEIKEEKSTQYVPSQSYHHETPSKVEKKNIQINDRELFLAAQNNDVDTLRQVLDSCPDKINTIDMFGWSLLMIACQANSVDIAQELLKRGADIWVRDRAGNSAYSLVIKNKNCTLADLLLQHRQENPVDSDNDYVEIENYGSLKEEYYCDTCNKLFSDKDEHLSSTIHNICASKGKKITANFVIPPSNKGYQLMLKDGWDRLSGLGPDGSGRKYPIKTVQKKDRNGLGLEKKKTEDKMEKVVKDKFRRVFAKDYHRNKNFEINFRRQFY